jgi:hypothetical protein
MSSPGSARCRVARKDHVCDECGKAIGPGDEYVYCTWLHFDEGWRSEKLCLGCFDPDPLPLAPWDDI